MGKKKLNQVFKVAGAKSLKLKSKAKSVNTQLKDIKQKTKSKIEVIDKELVKLQQTVRQSGSVDANNKEIEKNIVVKNLSRIAASQEDYDKLQNDSHKVLSNLDTMQL